MTRCERLVLKALREGCMGVIGEIRYSIPVSKYTFKTVSHALKHLVRGGFVTKRMRYRPTARNRRLSWVFEYTLTAKGERTSG